MKKGILLVATIILFTACFAQAQEGELTGSLDVTYRSAYTWYGIDRNLGAHGRGSTESTLDLDLYDTGFGVSTKWVLMNTSSVGNGSLVNAEELWLTLTYSGSCLEYETYATNYTIGWTYYDFPDNASSLVDTQEMFATLSWPEICPAGIVPSLTVVRMWKSDSGHHDTTWPGGTMTSVKSNDISGWVYIAGLGYDLPVEDLLPDLPEQILHLSAAFVWNEGAGAIGPGPGGTGVDHDLSHFVFGVSTDFDLGNNLTLTPGVYHQNTPEKSVNPDEDLTWASVGLKYSF